MNRNAIERALEKYAGHKDPTVRADLALWGPLLLEAADISQALRPSDIRANEPTNKELDQAVRGGPTLLSLGLVKIEEAAYADALKRLAAKLLETLKREHCEAKRSSEARRARPSTITMKFSKSPSLFSP